VKKNNKIKRIAIREIGFLAISLLLVILFYLLAGTFLKIWIKDYSTLILMTFIFYIIIGFYRWLNALARKYQNRNEEN
jgi:hypothetical protein